MQEACQSRQEERKDSNFDEGVSLSRFCFSGKRKTRFSCPLQLVVCILGLIV